MTEEIIIDGVDVSECGFLNNHSQTNLLLCDECNNDFAATECQDYTNCYYKQLKKLEEVKDRYLKLTLDDEIQINTLLEENEDLRFENVSLKRTLRSKKFRRLKALKEIEKLVKDYPIEFLSTYDKILKIIEEGLK